MFTKIIKKILEGGSLTKEEAIKIALNVPIHSLFEAATTIREHFCGNKVDLCSIVNAKSGACTEDCFYCAQSARYKTSIKCYPLMNKNEVIKYAIKAFKNGAKRFCIVTSGKKVNKNELYKIAEMVNEINSIGLLPCATLGLLGKEELSLLKDAGLHRYHHNIETSKKFFKNICTTHTFEEKIKTIKAAKSLGLSTCSGGIFGVGEGWKDRIEIAFILKELEVDSVPINFLIPIPGTPLGNKKPLPPFEALRIISIFRLILPKKEIRVCGGRLQILKQFNTMVFLAGANGLLIGNYLTQKGCCIEEDFQIIKAYGLKVKK